MRPLDWKSSLLSTTLPSLLDTSGDGLGRYRGGAGGGRCVAWGEGATRWSQKTALREIRCVNRPWVTLKKITSQTD